MTDSLRDVIAVDALPDHRVHVRFDNGVEGIIDVAQLIQFEGVFEPLREPNSFAQVTVHPELGTVCWPNGADLDSDVLYALITRGVNLAMVDG